MAKAASYLVVAVAALAVGGVSGHYLAAREGKSQTAKPDLVIEQFAIEGMTCEGCVSTVNEAIRGVAGVHTVKVSLPGKIAVVTYNPGEASPERIEAAVEAAGYKAHAK